ncbi:MAG: nascent polypeptide-associated complex protein [Candidatus Micrarchaeia archaeon]
MMPNMNPAQIEKMMKSMGIKSKNLNAKKVIIEEEDQNIVIYDPSVTEIEMQGQKSYQITGTVRIEQKVSEDDIQMVVQQTGVNSEDAKKSLIENDLDIAKTIMKLKKD